MKELAKQKLVFERKEVSKADALAYFTEKEDPYKLELINELEDGTITMYTQGNFTDLCRGPHMPHTGPIKAVKLLSVAGAYWRGDEKNKQLTRIYGITFPKAKELTEYLERLEAAKQRDHRKLGKELELFTFSQKVGAGLPLWLPKGTALRERLINFLKKAQDDSIIYLNYDAYKKDLEFHKNESVKFSDIKNYTTNLTFSSPNYELSILKADKDLEEKRETWHKNLKKDIYVAEALNVLEDLKMKPQYHFVKN